MVTKRINESLEDYKKRQRESSRKYRERLVKKIGIKKVRKIEKVRVRRFFEKLTNSEKEEYKKKQKEWCKNWRQKNPKKCKELSKQWQERNKKHLSNYIREQREKYKRLVLNHYGFKCACCGETRIEFLTIDHIHGRKGEHKTNRKKYSSIGLYRWLIKNNFPDGFQTLCFNCNTSKGFYGYCPHQKEQKIL